MSRYLTDLTWREVGVKDYIVRAPLEYLSNLVNAVITVPAGFRTDGESCPITFPIIYSLFGNVTVEGAVIHDWLYWTALYDRETSDKILLEAMGVDGTPAWRKWGIYYGLRIGGEFAWNEHRRLGHSIKDDFTANLKLFPNA